jgi:RNA polymerase sigma-70 factor (ECF subfamily)
LKCEQSAEEIVQDVFVKLWEKREKLSISFNLESYLFISVKNTSLNMIKFNNIRKNYHPENEYNPVGDDCEAFDAEAFRIQLGKAITQLPEQCRMIYYLKSFEGLTHDEIANYMNISQKTVESQVRIAMGKLRNMLFQYKDTFYAENYEK